MKNLEDLFIAEMKNLYALEKQIQETMVKLEPVRNKKLEKRINKFSASNNKDFDEIQSYLQDQSINPGNTTDSVANEMLINIESINSGNGDSAAMEAGLLASLNRLGSYKAANYENAYRMAGILQMKDAKKALKKIHKKALKQVTKFRKLARKSMYKKALG